MKNVDQTSQTSDQTLPDPPQILNATKTSNDKDKETLHDSSVLLNDILTLDAKMKQTTSFLSSFQKSLYLFNAELCVLKLSQMNEICKVGNSISGIKAKKSVHSEQVKNNKRLWDELGTKNTVIKLLIDNSKQFADSIGKSNTTVPLLDFSENSNFIPAKNMLTEKLTLNQNQQIYYYQIAINY